MHAAAQNTAYLQAWQLSPANWIAQATVLDSSWEVKGAPVGKQICEDLMHFVGHPKVQQHVQHECFGVQGQRQCMSVRRTLRKESGRSRMGKAAHMSKKKTCWIHAAGKAQGLDVKL